jgi:predicted ATPase/class 3 adenylate cyclase
MMGADLVERLRRAGVEASGQRRNITVLFADISGSTSLAEHLDSEDLYEILQETIRLLSNNVYKYEGVVDKIIGDGLMALFGAPISHENNAERAVRAALDMQNDLQQLNRRFRDDFGVDLDVRIGLHSGLVIIGGFGADDLMLNYTAVGDTVNLAHRIEEAAPPGSILVSETVNRQVKAIVESQQLSILNPKGIDHPVTAYQILRLKARPGALRGLEGFSAPMVGRDGELVILKQAADDLLANRRGHLSLITGEAGLGKSRLTAEFKASLNPAQVLILEGQSLAYRRVSYWLIRELLHSYLGLPSTSPPLQIRERLTRTIYQRMGEQAVDALPYLEHLMSLPYSDIATGARLQRMEPEQLRQQIFLTFRELISIEADHRPVVIILDDLHWADEASLELFVFLLDLLRQKSMLLLAVSRNVQSDVLERLVSWGRQNLAERFHELPLTSLSPDQSKQLLHLLVSIADLPEQLREQILVRSAGIPFYLEETLRMLIDQGSIRSEMGRLHVVPGLEDLSQSVPDSLKDLILARFDRLPLNQRQVLQVASVIGKDFNLPVLGAVARRFESPDLHSTVDDLVEREFILPHPASPETEFTFRHVLMSDAIYSTLLRKERGALHGQVAQAIERIFADRLDEQVEVLANHYRWSANTARAFDYQLLAGQKAIRNQANQQARQYFEAAIDMLAQVNPAAYKIYQARRGMGDVLLFMGEYPEARDHYLMAISPLEQGDRSRYLEERSSLYRMIARTYERQSEYERARKQIAQALDTLDYQPGSFPAERAQAWNDLAWIDFRSGNFAEADSLLHQALELVAGTDSNEVIASIYNRLGGVAYNQGDWEQAASFLRESIAIRESTRDLVNLATSLNNLGLLEIEMGQFDGAQVTLKRSYELKARLGQAEGIALALNNLGWLQIQRADFADAHRVLAEALELTQQIGYSSLHCQVLSTLGELYHAEGEWEQAQKALAEAAHALQEFGSADQLADVYRQLGEVALDQGDRGLASDWTAKAGSSLDSLDEESRSRTLLQRAEYLRLQGRLATGRADFQTARGYLNDSSLIFDELRSLLGKGRVLFCLGELALAQADYRIAKERLDQAETLFRNIGARLEADRTAGLLAEVTHHFSGAS